MDAKRLCCVYFRQIAGPEGRPSPSKKPREKSSDGCSSADGKICASGRSAHGRSAGAGGRSASAVGRSAGAVGATVVSKLVQTVMTGEVMEVKKKKSEREKKKSEREKRAEAREASARRREEAAAARLEQ